MYNTQGTHYKPKDRDTLKHWRNQEILKKEKSASNLKEGKRETAGDQRNAKNEYKTNNRTDLSTDISITLKLNSYTDHL